MSVASFLPVRLDLLLVRATDNVIEVTLSNPNTGTAYDITSDTITLTVRDGYAGTQLFTKSNAPGSHTTPASGVTRFSISRTDIADVANAAITKDFRYEIRRSVGGTNEVVFFDGLFRLAPSPKAS